MPTLRPDTRLVTPLRRKRAVGFYYFGLLALLILIHSFTTSAFSQSALHVGVSIPPQRYFLEQIAGELASVSVLMQQGGDPHSFSPTPQQMSTLSKAKIFFAAGLSGELHWRDEVASLSPNLELVQPHNSSLDRHFWLSPVEVIAQVEVMREALSRADPANSTVFSNNADAFVAQLKILHQELQGLYSEVAPQNRFLVQHSAWDVFADEYGLEQMVIADEGKSVTIKHLAKLVSVASVLQINSVYADLGHSSKEAQVIAEQIGADVQILDPLSGDWLNNLKSVAHSIKAGLR